jgi:hypothetical protein
VLLFTTCADDPVVGAGPSGSSSPSADIPTLVELVCGADGSVSLSSDRVQPQRDGVHLDVENGFDEPVSVEGFDAEPGTTTWVLTRGPGTMELMCWPFSLHGSGEEPPRIPLEIVDPDGLYFDGSVPCEPDGVTTVDWAEEPVDRGPPPLDIARDVIVGLLPDDVLRFTGYPEQEGAGIAVLRDGQVIAAYGIARFEGEAWSIVGGTACPDSGLPLAREQMG